MFQILNIAKSIVTDISGSLNIVKRVIEMKQSVKLCVLVSIILFVVSVYCYFYEASSMGFLPVINYPLRLYVVPFLILGLLFLSLAIVIHKFFQ